jgi:hypothetical protein
MLSGTGHDGTTSAGSGIDVRNDCAGGLSRARFKVIQVYPAESALKTGGRRVPYRLDILGPECER